MKLKKIFFESLDAFEAKDFMAWMDDYSNLLKYRHEVINDLETNVEIEILDFDFVKLSLNKTYFEIEITKHHDYYAIEWEQMVGLSFTE